MDKHKTILKITRDAEIDKSAMVKQYLVKYFYGFCERFEALQSKYQ